MGISHRLGPIKALSAIVSGRVSCVAGDIVLSKGRLDLVEA